MNGRICQQATVKGATGELDLSNASPGIYILTMQTNNGRKVSYKVVKQ
ncbi:T9SS type A sorting domain-containing protein [Chitinophaga sancti]|nr:T9SS type A sorting domain-containing protein [Chitinophaga sancti]WPQ66094.1 T9SS type A sorting domain-containing protein [Chitinophaga sancti]